MPIAVLYRPPAVTAEQYKATWSQGAPVAVPAGLVLEKAMPFSPSIFAPRFKQAMSEQGIVLGEPTILEVLQYIEP